MKKNELLEMLEKLPLDGEVSSECEGFKKFVKDNEFQCTSEELRPYLTTRRRKNVE